MTCMNKEGEGEQKEYNLAKQWKLTSLNSTNKPPARADRWIHNDTMTMVLSRIVSGMNEHKFNQQNRTAETKINDVHFPKIYLEAFPDRPIVQLRRKNKNCLSDEGIYGAVVIKIQNQAHVIHNKAQFLVSSLEQKQQHISVSIPKNVTNEKKNVRATEDNNIGSPMKKKSKSYVNEGVITNSIVAATDPTSVTLSHAGSITEVNSDYDVSHLLCRSCQVTMGNDVAGGKAMYIDSGDTICREDITGIAKGSQLHPQLTLNNVSVARVSNYPEMLNCLIQAGAIMMDDDKYVLLVIDSPTKLYSTNHRQEDIQQFSRILNNLVKKFKVKVVVVNRLS